MRPTEMVKQLDDQKAWRTLQTTNFDPPPHIHSMPLTQQQFDDALMYERQQELLRKSRPVGGVHPEPVTYGVNRAMRRAANKARKGKGK